MKSRRLIFLTVLYLMAFASFVVFVTRSISWVQYRFFAQPAVLFALPEAPINGPQDEMKQLAYIAAHGSAVRLKLPSGEEVTTRAFLTNRQLDAARTKAGINVLFRKADDISLRVVGSLDEVESPWLWLVLWLALAFAAVNAPKLPIGGRAGA